ncbi:MAG: Rpn family recombination-promoting nuclease/putative transposase [Suilimivivens sp.]
MKHKNSKVKDSSSKIIFGEPHLCSQFLRGYVNIPLLKDVQPEDIEDVTQQYLHIFAEERNSDVVKKVHLKGNETPFYLVSLIEHKSQIDYNVIMQILRYMVFIWENYEKEQEREHKGISKIKNFKYPPILPIVYYDGPSDWNRGIELSDRVFLSDVFESYIPNFKCILVQIKDYSNAELMEKRDALSIIMMISKLQKAADFTELSREVNAEYLNDVTANIPENLLDIIAQIVEILLLKVNVPREEAEAFAGQVKERPMGELFANFEAYDVQATRKEQQEEDIEKMIKILKELGIDAETVKGKLKEKFGLEETEIDKKIKMYW